MVRLVIIITLILVSCSICSCLYNNTCEISNVQLLSNPTKSFNLEKYEKDCGATTSTALTLAILKYSETPYVNTESFFVATSKNEDLDDIKSKWLSDSVLLVNYDKSISIFKRDSLIGNIKVLYEFR